MDLVLLISVLMILFLGYGLWFVSLKYFALKDELSRAEKGCSAMVSFLSKFSKSLAQLQDVTHARDLIGYYISEEIESQALCVYLLEEDGKDLFLYPTSRVGNYPGIECSKDAKSHRIKVEHDNFFGRIALEKCEVLKSRYAISDHLIKEALGYGLLEVSSVMAVPMIMEDSLIGIICAVNSQVPGYNFSDNDLRLFNSLAQQASFAYEFLKIYQKLSDQQRIGKELEVARHIQSSLLPKSIPSVGEYRFIPFSSPAKEVGGDYYDFIKIDDQRNLVVVADASGKGVPAGMIMTICRTALRAFAKNFTNLNDLLVLLNTILYDDTDGSHFITMMACVINHQNNEVEFARAGHTAFLTMKDAKVETFDPEGCALGLLPPQIASTFEVGKLICEKNQSILLFSDGITEAVDRNNEEFGIDRLCEAWRTAMTNPDRSSLPISIVDAVDNFTEYASPSDDRTILLIERV